MVLVTRKYQITIPKKVRKELNIKAGDEVIFIRTEEGYKIVKSDDIIEEGVEIFADIEETIEEVRAGLREGFD
jgi:AbrB family looped-hinge helix DNA binding protein